MGGERAVSAGSSSDKTRLGRTRRQSRRLVRLDESHSPSRVLSIHSSTHRYRRPAYDGDFPSSSRIPFLSSLMHATQWTLHNDIAFIFSSFAEARLGLTRMLMANFCHPCVDVRVTKLLTNQSVREHSCFLTNHIT